MEKCLFLNYYVNLVLNCWGDPVSGLGKMSCSELLCEHSSEMGNMPPSSELLCEPVSEMGKIPISELLYEPSSEMGNMPSSELLR